MRLRAAARRFGRCEQGVAALEFALVAPFLILLLLGGFEVSRFLRVQQKAEKIAFTIADVAAQADPVTGIDIQQVFAAVEQIMKPFPFQSEGLVVVTSTTQPAGEPKPTVRWQCENGGAYDADSKIGKEGKDAALPGGFKIDDDKDNVIVTEVFYQFSPVFGTNFTRSFTVYKTALFRPRLGALTSKPC